MDCHPRWKEGMKKPCQMGRENCGNRFRIVHALRAYLPAPAGIHKNQALRMLDEISKNRKAYPVSVWCGNLFCLFQQVKAIAIRDCFRNTDRTALKNMNIDHHDLPVRIYQLQNKGKRFAHIFCNILSYPLTGFKKNFDLLCSEAFYISISVLSVYNLNNYSIMLTFDMKKWIKTSQFTNNPV